MSLQWIDLEMAYWTSPDIGGWVVLPLEASTIPPYFPSSDIVLLLSGGSDNTLPQYSIGGDPSTSIINNTHSLNNLFSNPTPDQLQLGLVDYRCIYIFNKNATLGLKDVQILTTDPIREDGSQILDISYAMGSSLATEVQGIKIDGTAISGTFKLRVGSQLTAAIPFSTDVVVCTDNIQTALRLLTGMSDVASLAGVVVNPFTSPMPMPSGDPLRLNTIYYYTVSFLGAADNRAYELMQIVDNTLVDGLSQPVYANISRLSVGSPINSIAPQLDSDIIAPNGVTFVATSEASPLILGGTLQAVDIVPIWIRRTINATGDSLTKQSVTFKIRAMAYTP